jgi:Acyl-CoA dehydrogenases
MWCAMAVGTATAVKKVLHSICQRTYSFWRANFTSSKCGIYDCRYGNRNRCHAYAHPQCSKSSRSRQAFHREAYLARVLCAEKSMKIGTDGVQILGGHGFTKEHPVERWYRDLRATAILQSGLHA